MTAAQFHAARRIISVPPRRISFLDIGKGPVALSLHGFPEALGDAKARARNQKRNVSLEIDFQVTLRSGAADQDIAFRRRIERFGFVLDRAANQCGFATVADACTAGPADRNPAGFGEFEETLELPTPSPGDTAANK
jgi:hypothetical protein